MGRMTNAGRQACIVGIGESEYRRWGGFQDRSELALACEAIRKAAADAGVAVDEIDGLVSFAADRNEPSLLQDSLGLPNIRFATMAWGGGGTGACSTLLQAQLAVEAGAADHVICLRVLCQGQSRRYGQFSPGRAGNNFLAPFGMFAPPIMIAPLAQRYFFETGIRPEQIAEVALSGRANAQRNPRAVMHGRPMTLDDYLSCRMIADPLRLYDCTQENDGACALLVTSLERARDMKREPVRILAAAQGTQPGWGSAALGSHNMPMEEYGFGNGKGLARQLFGRAGIGPQDVDVAQIYDHFAPLVLMTLENFGFCGKGEAGDFVGSGAIRWPDGGLPINTSGGHLSEAYIHGLNLVVEGVRQLRGESTSQVADAEICLVTAGFGAPLTSGAILGV
jgi:acetyl-CoA acetyltransferase